MNRRRSGQCADDHMAEYDLLRKKAESEMEMGARFPEQRAPILRMNHAGLFRQEQSLVTASCHKSLKFEDVAANAQRLCGSCGGGGRQDALFTEEAAGSLEIDKDLEALAACKKVKKRGVGKKKKDGHPTRVGGKVKGGGRTLNGFYRRTGQRNRCYRRDIEYHLEPECPWRDAPQRAGGSFPYERDRAHRPS